MCHLILLAPVVALVVFWIWPLTVAVPVYAVVFILSLWMYAFIWQAMRRPVQGGREEMLHSIGEVMEVQGRSLHVRTHHEIWNAESRESLRPGDRVKVVGMSGLILQVERLDAADGDRSMPVEKGPI